MKMRISALVLLTLLSVSCAWAQSPNSAPNLQSVNYVDVLKKQLLRESGIYQPQATSPAPAPAPTPQTPLATGKTSALTVVPVGKASNPFTILQVRQNQVFANDQFNMVGWIHRQDQELWGGTPIDAANGVLRFDYSIDASTGAPHSTSGTWTIDRGPLNALPYPNAARARYPQAVPFVPGNAGSSFDSVRFAFIAPTTDGAGWGNYNYGYAKRLNSFCRVSNCNFGTTNNTVYSNYGFISNQQDQLVLIPGGLSVGKRLPGNQSEFWTVDIGFRNSGANDGVTLDYFTIWKAVSGANDQVTWTRAHTIRPPYAKYVSSGSRNFYSTTGNPLVGQFNMAVSPNKKWIWVCLNSDLAEPGFPNNQTPDINPVLYYSDDSGATFQGPIEIKLREYKTIIDSTKTYFNAQGQVLPSRVGAVDSTLGIPQASNFDIVVDANGNPHIFTRLVSAAEESGALDSLYYFSPGARACLWDITTTDQGKTWCPVHIQTLNAVEAPKQGYDLDQDNHPQVSTNEAGTVVFYSWVDDIRTGLDANGRNAMVPNLWTRSRKITGQITDVTEHSSNDPTYRGAIWFPSMSPTVRTYQSGGATTYQMPIVFLSEFGPIQLASTGFSYISNITYTDNAATYKTPAVDLAIDQVLQPDALLCGASGDDVSFVVRNVGTTPVTSFQAVYSINGGAPVTQTVTPPTPIAPNGTFTYTFPAQASMPNNGTYVVRMQAIVGGDFNCANNTAERVVVNVGGTSAQIFPSANPPAYCGTAVLDAGVQNGTYVWELLGGGGPVTIGTTQQIVRSVTPGEQIRVTVSVSGCSTLIDTINIVVNDLPNVSLPADTAACVTNLPLVLDADPTIAANRSFVWKKNDSVIVGQTGRTLSVTNVAALGSGSYTAVVTNTANGCKDSATVNVRVWDITVDIDAAIKAVYGNSASAVGGVYNLCGSRSIDVSNASNLGSSYQWYKDGVLQGNNPFPLFDSTGSHTYRVVIKDPLNCKTLDQTFTVVSSDSVFARISTNLSSFPNGQVRSGCDTVCFKNTSTDRATPVSNFFWQYIGSASNTTLISGSLGNSSTNGSDSICYAFANTVSGTRVVRLNVTSGSCTSSIDLSFTVVRGGTACQPQSVSSSADFGFDVFPNPTNGMLNISLQMVKGGNATFRLVDLTGREVMNYSREVSATQTEELDLSTLPSGIYLIQVTTDLGTAVSRIVKN